MKDKVKLFIKIVNKMIFHINKEKIVHKTDNKVIIIKKDLLSIMIFFIILWEIKVKKLLKVFIEKVLKLINK